MDLSQSYGTSLEVLSNLSDQTLEGHLAEQQLGEVLVSLRGKKTGIWLHRQPSLD